jgi:hypothetical protein
MTASTLPTPRFPGAAAVTAGVWLALVVIAGATGFFARLPFPGPQIIILGLLAGTVIAATTIPALRAWIDALPLRVLIGVNATRFVGIVFLALAARGRLNQTFADRAGWGDIAIAVLAMGFVLAGATLRSPLSRGLLHAWNLFGFLDLVVAVGTATMVTLRLETPGVAPVLSLPLVIVPTFLVPLFLANHVVIFRRLVAAGGTGYDD